MAKMAFVGMLALALPVAFSSSVAMAFDSPAIECYKLAMSDPTVFVNERAADITQKWFYASSNAIKLCAGATDANAPVDCYKAVMSDPTMFVNEKSKDKLDGGNYASQGAVSLCAAKIN